MTDQDDLPPRDHNMPPVSLEDLPLMLQSYSVAQIAEALPDFDAAAYAELKDLMVNISSDAAEWIKAGKIKDAETASMAADHIAQLRAARKKCEDVRKAVKKVWADKATRAYDAMSRLVNSAEVGIEKMLAIHGEWLKAENEKKEAEVRRLREEAEAKRAEVEAAKARAEESGDIMGIADAEAAEKEAKKAEKEVARAEKASISTAGAITGGRVTLKKVKIAHVKKYTATWMHFRDHEKMKELVQQLASAAVRAADFDPKVHSIPGVEVEIKEVPV